MDEHDILILSRINTCSSDLLGVWILGGLLFNWEIILAQEQGLFLRNFFLRIYICRHENTWSTVITTNHTFQSPTRVLANIEHADHSTISMTNLWQQLNKPKTRSNGTVHYVWRETVRRKFQRHFKRPAAHWRHSVTSLLRKQMTAATIMCYIRNRRVQITRLL